MVNEVCVSKILVHPIKSCKGISVQSANYTPEGIEYDRKWCIIDPEAKRVITARAVPKMVLITPLIERDESSPYGGVLTISFPSDSSCEPFSVPLNPTTDILSHWTILTEFTLWPSEGPVDGYICQSLDAAHADSPTSTLSKYFGKPVQLMFKGPRPRPVSTPAAFPDLTGTAIYHDEYPLLLLSEEGMDEIDEKARGYVGMQGVEDNWMTDKVEIERFRPNIVLKGGGAFIEDEWEAITIGTGPSLTLVAKCARCLLPNISTETGIRDKAIPYKILMKFRTGLNSEKKMTPLLLPRRPPPDVMTRARWRFGATHHHHSPQEPTKPEAPVPYSADAKQFGLENFGNTCYANSVIQALYFCSPFRDLMLQEIDTSNPQEHVACHSLTVEKPNTPQPQLTPIRPKPERKPSISANNTESFTSRAIPSAPPTLFSALRSLFAYIAYHPLQKGAIAPRAFVEKLKELNELFRSTMHQDAHELLMYLLNRVVEEIEEERKQVQRTVEDLSNSVTTLSSPPTIMTTKSTSSNAGTSPQDATLVHKLFEGVLTSETRCLTCETTSSRDESFLDLSIDIEKNSSVTACLRQFSASEMLSQKNKFFCDSCCGLQEAEKRMKIKKLPNVLALHLKRFKYQEDVQKYIKLTYRVAFPFELRLFNTIDGAEDADRLYNLYAIVVHIGNGPHHGHYVSIIKTLGQWSVFDDDNVFPIPEQDISKYFGDSNAGAAYLLYYQAADIDRTALGLQVPPPAEEPKDAPILANRSSRSTSPTQETQPMFPPGLSNNAATDLATNEDTSSTTPIHTEENHRLDDSHEGGAPSTRLETESDLSSSHLTQPNGISSHRSLTGGILTGLRRPTSFSRSKTFGPESKSDLQGQASVSNCRSGASKPSSPSPKRPSTSAGVFFHSNNQEREKEKDTTSDHSKSNHWFRRSFKNDDKTRPTSAVSPPLPLNAKTNGQVSFLSLSDDEVATPTVDPVHLAIPETSSDCSLGNGRNGILRSHTISHSLRTQGHALQRPTHNLNGYDGHSPENSISSYGSTSLSHPTSSSRHSSSLRHSTHIPEFSRMLEHRKSISESHGDRREYGRPLPPIPSSPIMASDPVVSVTNGDLNAHEPVPRSPTRSSATTHSTLQLSNSHHSSAKDGLNVAAKHIRRASRKLSFTAPFFHIGRKDKVKH
ncbi:hypothetical protein APHAL10511_005990 [Amanita phalloides]|nr:hypothetical protein APHAL10511_005990 [Amanita phalloides]